MFTAPLKKADLIHMTGIMVPTILLAKTVYTRNNRGWKCIKRPTLPSSRYVSSIQTI
jgi:hypothetical protein